MNGYNYDHPVPAVRQRRLLVCFTISVLWCLTLAVVGCNSVCDVMTVRYGTCGAPVSSGSGLYYGDRQVQESFTEGYLSYGCSSSNIGIISEGDTACFDPRTPPAEWEFPQWQLSVSFDLPTEVAGCSNSQVEILLQVNALTYGPPVTASTFDLALTAEPAVRLTTFGRDTDYKVTSGELIVSEATANRYTFEIRNLVLTKSSGGDETNSDGCYLPETIAVDSITSSCVPGIEESTNC